MFARCTAPLLPGARPPAGMEPNLRNTTIWGASRTTSSHARITYLSVSRTNLFPRTNVTYLAMPTGPGRRSAHRAGPPVCWPVWGTRPKLIWPSLR